MPKILTDIQLAEDMPAGSVVDVPQETYDHLKALGEKGTVLYKDYTPETEAEVKAAEEKKINEQAEQDKIVKAMAVKTLATQMKELYPDIDSNVNIDVSFKGNDDKVEHSGAFKSLAENVQMAAALMGRDFKGADQMRNNWKTNQKHFTSYKAITGQSESVNADGGFLVDSFFDRNLISRLLETAVMYGKCDLRQVGVGSNGLKWNGRIDYDRSLAFTQNANPLRVKRTGEGVTKEATKFTLEQFELKLLKLVGLNYLTDELLEDVPALEAEIVAWFIEEFGAKNDDEIFNGNGTTQMQGILDAATTARIDVARAGVGAAPTIDHILSMYANIAPRSVANAEWYYNHKLIVDIAQMAIGNMPVFMAPGNGLTQAPNGSLLGRPLVPIEQAALQGTLGDINLWDLSQYRTIQKGGIKIDKSEEVRFIDDETVLRFVMRNNGLPKWSTFMTLRNGETVSPFVSLATGV